jgi:hypothetical protein
MLRVAETVRFGIWMLKVGTVGLGTSNPPTAAGAA